jgi:exopolyphosphatase/guanosine-5'-triphosphate,3'-diphosphate pyrophosphatase
MKKAGKKLFQALGELRDMQVTQEWLEKLGDTNDPVTVKLLDHIHAREAECKQLALKDLNQFDRKQWRQWSRTLPQRAARTRPGSVVYLHLALEKWTAAYELHKHAVRVRSQAGWHTLRIGIKRFRYTVENFLPRYHACWGDDMKELQNLLGDIHDLDVLWAMAVEIQAFPDIESRNRWRQKLNHERDGRISRYREKMVGRNSLWRVWRAQLPSGPELRAAAMSRLRAWAGYLDPDFQHSQRVAQLALLLYDGLKDAGLLMHGSTPETPEHGPRAVLRAAALMHDVGKVKEGGSHHKDSYRMIRNLNRPLGWSARELELAAVVARFHRGALPSPRRKVLQRLELPDRPIAMELAAVLRLANALETRSADTRNHTEQPTRLEVSLQGPFVLVRAARYSPLDRSAEGIAAARHLLETILRRPVIVRTLRTSAGGKGYARERVD